MKTLPKERIIRTLKTLPGWAFENNEIHKELEFDSYMKGIEFINQLAVIAEKQQHHPDLTVGWCKVGISFSTHDAGGVTEKDITMAKAVESLLK